MTLFAPRVKTLEARIGLLSSLLSTSSFVYAPISTLFLLSLWLQLSCLYRNNQTHPHLSILYLLCASVFVLNHGSIFANSSLEQLINIQLNENASNMLIDFYINI